MIIVIGGMAGLAIASYLLDQIRVQERNRARESVQRSPVAPPQRTAIPQNRTTTPSPLPKNIKPQSAPVVRSSPRSQPIAPRPIPEQENRVSPTGASPSESPSRPSLAIESSPMPTDLPAEPLVKEKEPLTSPDLPSLPSVVDLPPISSRELELLIQMPIAEDLEVELASDLITLDSAYAFVAKKVSTSTPVHWEIYLQKALDVGTQQVLVANLTAAEKGLVFHWTNNATKATVGQLKNCLMQLKSGGELHKIALRSPLRPKATRLTPGKDKFKATFDIEDLPRPEYLRLDVDVSYDDLRVASESGTQTTTKGKRLHFKINELRDVEIQVTLLSHKEESLILQALPKHQLTDNRQLTLSTDEVDILEQRISRSIIKAQRDLAKAQNALEIARRAFSSARNSATKAFQNKIIENKANEIANSPKKLAAMKYSLSAVGDLRSLVSSVQLNTLIRYRIYAESNESWLLLVDGDYEIRKPSDEVVRPEGFSGAKTIELDEVLVFIRNYDRNGTDVQARKKTSEMVRELEEMVRGKSVTARFLVANVRDAADFRLNRKTKKYDFAATGKFLVNKDVVGKLVTLNTVIGLGVKNVEDVNIGNVVKIHGTLEVFAKDAPRVTEESDIAIGYVRRDGNYVEGTRVSLGFSESEQTIEELK